MYEFSRLCQISSLISVICPQGETRIDDNDDDDEIAVF